MIIFLQKLFNLIKYEKFQTHSPDLWYAYDQ